MHGRESAAAGDVDGEGEAVVRGEVRAGRRAGAARRRGRVSPPDSAHAGAPPKGPDSPRKGRAYVAACVLFALGLMAKPMLVTLPFLLLLLDVWPFRRIGAGGGTLRDPRTLSRLVVEKAPFFALAAASCVVTFLAQRSGGAVSTLERWPLGIRAANALTSYTRYLLLTVWPAHLSVFYPMPRTVPLGSVLASAALLLGGCALAVGMLRRRAYIATGWFWYVGMLVPVIGIVKIGGQSMADRYTYLPSSGIFILLSWGLSDALGRSERGGAVFAAIAVVLCLGLAVSTRVQLAYWKNSETLFTRALDVTSNNALAHYNLGTWLVGEGREEAGADHLAAAIRIDPDDAMARANLGASLFRRGRADEARRELEHAVRLDPADPVAHASLGGVLIQLGRLDEALAHEREALRLRPGFPEAHLNLGVVYGRLGRADDAIREYAEAVRLDPESADARGNLGAALANRGRAADALAHLAEAVRLRPGSAAFRANLGNVLLMLGRPVEAAEQYREALRIEPGSPAVQSLLDRALRTPPGALSGAGQP